MLLAEKLCAAIANSSPPVVGAVTVSIGVAVANAQHDSEEIALREADEALYSAKSQGRNRAITKVAAT